MKDHRKRAKTGQIGHIFIVLYTLIHKHAHTHSHIPPHIRGNLAQIYKIISYVFVGFHRLHRVFFFVRRKNGVGGIAGRWARQTFSLYLVLFGPFVAFQIRLLIKYFANERQEQFISFETHNFPLYFSYSFGLPLSQSVCLFWWFLQPHHFHTDTHFSFDTFRYNSPQENRFPRNSHTHAMRDKRYNRCACMCVGVSVCCVLLHGYSAVCCVVNINRVLVRLK